MPHTSKFQTLTLEGDISFEEFKKSVLNDYKIAVTSREISNLGVKEVLTGKAKFGVFSAGLELCHIALAKQFKKGDWRSGYYRDQTIVLALGEVTIQQFFAEMYAHTDLEAEPHSGGRQMNGHYASRSLDEQGNWKDLTTLNNIASDLSPTAAQMPRLVGLAFASKQFKENPELKNFKTFSKNGKEVAFGTIGDSSTSEGVFFEAINAAGVLQIPMAISIWDNGYGISVPRSLQTTKDSISEALSGFKRTETENGIEIFNVKGYDYPALCETYEKAIELCRNEHIPVLIHVEDLTQPQGHSTSGSHERYKSDERLQWYKDYDCITKFEEWITENAIASQTELDVFKKQAVIDVKTGKEAAWQAYLAPIKAEAIEATLLLKQIAEQSKNKVFVNRIIEDFESNPELNRKLIISAAKRVLRLTTGEYSKQKQQLVNWLNESSFANNERYNTYVLGENDKAISQVKPISPSYSESPKIVDGREIIRDNFDAILTKNPLVSIFGEDVGVLGDVNKSLENLQQKHGIHKVFDTGIREATIVGQAIGMALRGLRPIAEIQYLDYIYYAIQILSDDVASLHWRTKGGQKCPLIIRTRGHRLEGIWHSGSPMAMIINAVRGMHVCVPRNFVQAAGMYNTLLEGNDPAIVIEPLNQYRCKEAQPTNFGDFKIALGHPEIVVEGTDITIVSYGSTFHICHQALKQLHEVGIYPELIDAQTLMPFDVNHIIGKSVQKTNRLLVVDEDVPGGATAYMLQKIIEEQEAYQYLDSAPKTVTAKDHRPAYGTDGDYFSKPNCEDIFDAAYSILHEAKPETYPSIY